MRYLATVLLAGLLLPLLLPEQSPAQSFTFTRIADTNTPIPGGSSNFVLLTPPRLSDGQVLVRGGLSDTDLGLYIWRDGALEVVADQSTQIPGSSELFTGFAGGSIDAGVVAFTAGLPDYDLGTGIYLWEDGVLSTLVAEGMPIPGGAGATFELFGAPMIRDGAVAFVGAGSSVVGVYVRDETGIRTIADTSTAIPDGTGTFNNFFVFERPPSLHGDDVAFIGGGSGGQRGVYKSVGGVLTRVADRTTAVPHPPGTGSATFVDFDLARPLIHEGNVMFGHVASNQAEGIYSDAAGSLSTVYRAGETPVPGGAATSPFTGLALQRSRRGDSVSFLGSHLYSGVTQGVYTDINGTLETVIATYDDGDPVPPGVQTRLDGKRVLSMGHYTEGTSANQVVFLVVGFEDGSSGVYLATSTLCGDGYLNPATEECDDGNAVAGDGCSACRLDVCGDVNANGRIDPGDATELRMHLADPLGLPLSTAGSDRCPVIDPLLCDVACVAALRRTLEPDPLPPGLAPVCPALTALAQQGAACITDGDCASRFCSEGVCCDSACLSPCQSCLAAATGATDGACAQRIEAVEVCDFSSPGPLVDNDCDATNNGDPDLPGCTILYANRDGDTQGDPTDSACLCDRQAPYTSTLPVDCDDTDPEVFATTFYEDGDGDGWADWLNPSALLCAPEEPFTTPNGGDCDDTDPDAFPGQTAYFEQPRGNGSFDYNCDSVDELQFDALGSCMENIPGLCTRSVGWAASVPACGLSGDLVGSCNRVFCTPILQTSVQSCR